ncbi:GNAT family N-acetyltransferase [Brevundimonas sp. TWP2-3-4b1]|uniref:GNAT family N-acetyltransferase n=1 Tax=Brevundimonas sp. TWP2-3-4b1 TaxID=2804580 RepID=UPI003CF1DA7E
MFRTYAGQAGPMQFMNFPRHRDVAESVTFADFCEACWRSGSAFPWAVTDRVTGQFMGALELRLKPPRADLGYILGERFWGQGFAGEAASAVVAWAIAQPGIFRVWATCHPENVASAAVLRRAGLTYEATLANWDARPQLGEAAGPNDCYALTRSPGTAEITPPP